MKWGLGKNRKRKKDLGIGVSAETIKKILPDMVDPTPPPPPPDYTPGLRTPEVNYLPEPYVEPSDKEIIEGLEFCDNYEAAFLIRSLKKQNMILKGKLTKLTKKYDACEADRQMYMKQLNHLHGKTE